MIRRYEFWWAKVKYEDCDHVEIRPVLAIAENVFISAYKVTKKDRGDDGFNFHIEYWENAGLEDRSSIRLTKLLKLRESDMVGRIGTLDERDRMRLELRLATLRYL